MNEELIKRLRFMGDPANGSIDHRTIREAADELERLSRPAPAAPVATEAVALPKGRNSFGLDLSYFGGKMGRIMRDMSSYKPDEFARECARMAATADASVLREPEFGAVAHGGGVDVEKSVAAAVEGWAKEWYGADLDSVEREYLRDVIHRALLTAAPAGVGDALGWVLVEHDAKSFTDREYIADLWRKANIGDVVPVVAAPAIAKQEARDGH